MNGFRFLPGPLSSDSIRAQINHKLTKESAQEQKTGTRTGARKSKIPCARQQNYLRAGTKRPKTGSNTKHTSKCETRRTSKCETKHTSKCETTRTSECKTTCTSKHNNNQHNTKRHKTTQNTKTRLDCQICYRRLVVVVRLSSFCRLRSVVFKSNLFVSV